MSSILLDTLTATTDPFAGLASGKVSFTYATVKWQNPSSTSAEYRIVTERITPPPTPSISTSSTPTKSLTPPTTSISKLGNSNFEHPRTTVGAKQQGELTVFPLQPGTSARVYLERYEIDSWVRQTSTSSLDYVLVSAPTTSLSVASGSTSAKLTFAAPVPDATYMVVVYPQGTNQFREATVVVNNGAGVATIGGLKKGQKYTAGVGIQFPQHIKDTFGNLSEDGVPLHSVDFTTSTAAEMVLEGPFASYMGIDWLASVDGQGSDYRIVNRVGESDDVLVESSTKTSATIENLKPGSEYRIVLQRKEFGGKWSDQNEVVANTLGSSLSLSSVASKTLELSWTSLYPGASFEIIYAPVGGSEMNSGQTQQLSTILRNLQAGTAYELSLVVHELGRAVGLARLGMKTNDGGILSGNLKYGVIAVIVLLLGFFMTRLTL